MRCLLLEEEAELKSDRFYLRTGFPGTTKAPLSLTERGLSLYMSSLWELQGKKTSHGSLDAKGGISWLLLGLVIQLMFHPG